MNEWMNEWINESMNQSNMAYKGEWMNEWMNEQFKMNDTKWNEITEQIKNKEWKIYLNAEQAEHGNSRAL